MNLEQGFSIIIPTLHEIKNIPLLVKSIASVDFKNRPFELILVDDNSQDGSVELVKELTNQYVWLRMIVRKAKPDLSRSILEGIKQAQYPICVTMDADLSHPPDKILSMIEKLDETQVDAIFGSRFLPESSIDETWVWSRKCISRLTAFLANLLLPFKMTDPLSGFMAIRREKIFSGDTLNPIGWKIGLEILIKCHCQKVIEIPIHFSNRHAGYSKLSLKIGYEYFKHLLALARYQFTKRSTHHKNSVL